MQVGARVDAWKQRRCTDAVCLDTSTPERASEGHGKERAAGAEAEDSA
jgi:hypothetical protein